ncbi:MAG: hypothetical protein ACLTZY_07235 [Alistipes indistinctus]
MNIGQPDIPTPQVAIDAVKNIHDKIFAYGHSAGLETYRRKLVGYYQSVGIELGYENLLITDGDPKPSSWRCRSASAKAMKY